MIMNDSIKESLKTQYILYYQRIPIRKDYKLSVKNMNKSWGWIEIKSKQKDLAAIKSAFVD